MTGEPGDAPRPTITLPGRSGPGAIIRRAADGIYRAEILDETTRAQAVTITEFLNRPRPSRRRPSC